MPNYNSAYTGAEIDAAVGAVQAAVAADGIVNTNGLDTILRNYLTSSSAANTYLTKSDAASTYAPLTGTGTSGTWPISISGNAATATKATQDGSGNTITSYYCTLSTAQNFTGTKSWGTSGAGGQLNGAATNGGINSIRIGDDVWLGDCNQSGIMGMKSTGASCGICAYNSDGTNIGHLVFGSSSEIRSNSIVNFLTTGGACQHAKFGRIGLADSYSTINLTNYRFHCNGGHARFDGTVNIYPGATSGWTEGLRIHASTAGWATLILCGTDNTGDSGTSANSWSMHTLNGNFYIAKNGSNTNSYFYNEGIWRFANLGVGGSYGDSALQIFSVLSGGPSGWGGAPRLGFHWGGVNAAQLGVASDGYIYECPGTGTAFYRVQIITGSSRTIKHDIKSLPDMGDQIDLLQPVSFIYNDHPDEGIRYGLIHEDTVEIMPDICKFNKNQHGGKTVNYTDLIPVLIKEIQSLRKRLKSLEDKNN